MKSSKESKLIGWKTILFLLLEPCIYLIIAFIVFHKFYNNDTVRDSNVILETPSPATIIRNNEFWAITYYITPTILAASTLLSFISHFIYNIIPIIQSNHGYQAQNQKIDSSISSLYDVMGIMMGSTLLPSLSIMLTLISEATTNNTVILGTPVNDYTTNKTSNINNIAKRHTMDIIDSIINLRCLYSILTTVVSCTLSLSFFIFVVQRMKTCRSRCKDHDQGKCRNVHSNYHNHIYIIQRNQSTVHPTLIISYMKTILKILIVLIISKIVYVLHHIYANDIKITWQDREGIPIHHPNEKNAFIDLIFLLHATFFFITFLLHLRLYDEWNMNRWSCSPLSSLSPEPTSSSPFSTKTSLQHVFTLGEYILLSTMTSILFTNYIIQYSIVEYSWNTETVIDDNVDDAFDNQDSFRFIKLICKYSALLNHSWVGEENKKSITNYLPIAYSGIIGCLIGSVICTLTCNNIAKYNRKKIEYRDATTKKNDDVLMAEKSTYSNVSKLCSSIIKISVKYQTITVLLIIVSFTISNLDWVLWSLCLSRDDEQDFSNLSSIDQSSLSIVKEWFQFLPEMSSLLTTNISCDTGSSYKINPLRPIWWLFSFLSSSETKHDQINLNGIAYFRWLLYWFCILVMLVFPSAIYIAIDLQRTKCDNTRSRKTIIARKFFHLVAILLFLPPTFYSPKMMSLSYAIATALLIVIESIKGITQILSQQQNTTPSSGATSKKNNVLHQMYEIFFDEKDKEASNGGYIVTHLALIIGCAFPLWISEIWLSNQYMKYSLIIGSNSLSRKYMMYLLLPYLGIIELGVGDALGAVVGIYFGKRTWPKSKRTLEGSVGMFLSTFCSLYIISWLISSKMASSSYVASEIAIDIFILTFVLTLLEACTVQIDNLCLPLVASFFCFSLM